MGGKGKKRREKNYRAAHGGYSRLPPPPPDPSQLDALPSKLRKLISLTYSQSEGFSVSFFFFQILINKNAHMFPYGKSIQFLNNWVNHIDGFVMVFPGSAKDSKNVQQKRKNGDDASELVSFLYGLHI